MRRRNLLFSINFSNWIIEYVVVMTRCTLSNAIVLIVLIIQCPDDIFAFRNTTPPSSTPCVMCMWMQLELSRYIFNDFVELLVHAYIMWYNYSNCQQAAKHYHYMVIYGLTLKCVLLFVFFKTRIHFFIRIYSFFFLISYQYGY